MNKYQAEKEKARDEAIYWQLNFNDYDYDYLELAECQNYFTRKAKRYGLVKEFKENGII